ncbi:MAG: hypothetical protein AB8B79_19930 [Granulosicoccus sp.]
MKIPAIVVTTSLILTSAAAFSTPLWRVEGFSQPESALFDKQRDRIIVSNIDGHPAEADGQGFLSLLSMQGEVIEHDWVTGLNAPKGMAILGDELLVTDLTELLVIDLDSAAIKTKIKVTGSLFLNDVTASAQVAWITDLLGNALYQYSQGEVTLWLKDEDLAHPNGVFLDDQRLIVGSWGKGLQDDFSTEHPGGLLQVSLDDKKITSLPGGGMLGNLDGVFRYKKTLITNDWLTGDVFVVDQDGELSTTFSFPAGLSDISRAEELFLMPYMHEGAVEARSLNGFE